MYIYVYIYIHVSGGPCFGGFTRRASTAIPNPDPTGGKTPLPYRYHLHPPPLY